MLWKLHFLLKVISDIYSHSTSCYQLRQRQISCFRLLQIDMLQQLGPRLKQFHQNHEAKMLLTNWKRETTVDRIVHVIVWLVITMSPQSSNNHSFIKELFIFIYFLETLCTHVGLSEKYKSGLFTYYMLSI